MFPPFICFSSNLIPYRSVSAYYVAEYWFKSVQLTCVFVYLFKTTVTSKPPFHAELLMESCKLCERLSSAVCSRSSAVYLITDAVDNEWNLIETAIITTVSLPVNLLSSMMSLSSWLQIDFALPGAQTHTHAGTPASKHTHSHSNTHGCFRDMSGLCQTIDMFF